MKEVASYAYTFHTYGSFGYAEDVAEAEEEMERMKKRWTRRYGYATAESIIKNITAL